jgi:hypothetical protein
MPHFIKILLNQGTYDPDMGIIVVPCQRPLAWSQSAKQSGPDAASEPICAAALMHGARL